MYNKKSFRIFTEYTISFYFRKNNDKIKNYINQERVNQILNVNETQYVEHLKSKFAIDNLEFYFDNIYASEYKKNIPGSDFPNDFHVESGKKYSKQVIVYHIPVSGEKDLLHCCPSSRYLWSQEVYIVGNDLCFEIINFRNKPKEINQKQENIISNLKKQYKNIKKEVVDYNLQLTNICRQLFISRKQKILKEREFAASLNVPIKLKDNIKETYSIPIPEKKEKIIPKPVASDDDFIPEPTLDKTIYNKILQTIFDLGKVFERLPATYTKKEEEELRDHLLLYLEPRFEGSATGETFNKSGKTDILIRYQNSNVFIAECKFWNGQKKYLETISQLLNYLTWRDSKASVIIFVRNKNFSSVLNTVEQVTKKHSNFIRFINKNNESWFNYIFHINGDEQREVKLAVLLFHIPPS